MTLGIQLFSMDFGDSGNSEIVVDWAVADYAWQEWLGVRVGKLKTPFGLYNEIRDIDATRTGILLPESVYSSAKLRSLMVGVDGIAAYGYSPFGFSYTLQYGHLDDQKIKDYGFDTDGRVIDQASMESVIATQVLWEQPWDLPFVDTFILGISHWRINELKTYRESSDAFGPGPETEYSVTATLPTLTQDVFSLQYSFSKFTFTAEYITSQVKTSIDYAGINGDTLPDMARFNTGIHPATNVAVGYYVMASYRLTDYYELAGTYSESIGDKENRNNSDNFIKDFVFSSRFDINGHWLLKAEVHCIHGFGNSQQTEGDTASHWNLYAVKTSYAF